MESTSLPLSLALSLLWSHSLNKRMGMEKLVKAMQKSGGKKKREEDEGQKQRWGAREGVEGPL